MPVIEGIAIVNSEVNSEVNSLPDDGIERDPDEDVEVVFKIRLDVPTTSSGIPAI